MLIIKKKLNEKHIFRSRGRPLKQLYSLTALQFKAQADKAVA